MTAMVFLLVLALTAQQADIRVLADADLRVATIGDRLARGGAAVCPGQSTSLGGLIIQDARQYSAAMRADARRVLALRDAPTIVAVAGAASKTIVGKAIIAVEGQSVAAGASDAYADVGRAEALIEEGFAHGKATLALDDEQTVELPSTSGCRSRFQIVRGGLGRTQSDGRYVQLSEGMLGFTVNDDEVAAVLAHELAHNVLGHQAKKTPSKQAEYEADWLSVWLVARAGYNLEAIVPFWTRLGKRTDYGIFSDGSHPGWKRRVARFEVAIAKVKAQRASGQPLLPAQ